MIITGSGQGLGKGFAARLLNAGAKVCNLARQDKVSGNSGSYQVCLSDLREDTGEQTRLEFEEKFGKENVHFIQ